MKPEVKSNRPWELGGYSDTYYAGDRNNHKIMTGYTIILNGLFIS